ncbi:MAG: ferritin [Syntrophomonadaceae bacterium]|nr:ferritin [Syntrophomonadaceae bacterium]
MIKENISKVLSEQVNAEYYSAYLYLIMSAYADRTGFKGVANWLFIQAQEEMAHGTHIYQHILERGGAPAFADVKTPEAALGSIKDVFKKVVAHEEYVTGLINNIATIALKENDHATYNFIMWYVNEQIEEEASANEILNKIDFIGDNLSLLYNLDVELSARVFTDPFSNTAD